MVRSRSEARQLTSSSAVASSRSLALGADGDSHPSGIVHGTLRLGDGGHSLLTSSENGLLVPIVRLWRGRSDRIG